MSIEISVPAEIPVMTLANVVLFPQAILPLHIYEPRYRKMLEDVLDGDRLFVVAGQDVEKDYVTDGFESPYPVASVGVVRASHQCEGGTSNLIVQGLVRVRFKQIVREDPYRVVQIEPLWTTPGATSAQLHALRKKLIRVLHTRYRLGNDVSDEVLHFLESLHDPEVFLDLSVFTLCPECKMKQQLLETLETRERFQCFLDYMERLNEELIIDKKLRGDMDDDQIALN